MANNLIAQIANEFVSGNTQDVVDIITFLEAPWGLGINLYPVQKFILKCAYGLPLDDTPGVIPVPDIVNDRTLYEFSEQEFLQWLYDEGRCNTNNVVGCNFSEIVMVVGRRGSKCRSSLDLIATTEGTITFKELLERKSKGENIGILTYDENYKRSTTFDFKAWDNGSQECFHLRTKSGIKETSSFNHPYLVWRDGDQRPRWVDLEDVVEGDRIAVSKSMPIFGSEKIGVDRAAILGFLCGDGGVTTRVSFTSESKIQVDDFQRCLDNEFAGYELRLDAKSKVEYTVVKKSRRYAQGGSQRNMVKDWLKEIGVFGYKATSKRVPDLIMTGSKSEVSAFISRIFACDGFSVTDNKSYGRKKPKSRVAITLASEGLIDDLRHLLLKFGINATVRHNPAIFDGKLFDAWTLSLDRAEDIEIFKEEIGILSKEDALAKTASASSISALTNRGGYRGQLPKGVWAYIDELKEKHGLSDVDVTGKYGAGHNERLRREYCPSKVKVASYAENLNDDFLRSISDSDIIWDIVDKVEKVGKIETVDLCVEGTHVIGGDIVSHNSVLASCISTYELYKLIKRADPAEYYNLLPGSEISILNVAPTDEQSSIVYGNIVNYSMSCPYLKDRILNRTLGYMKMQSDADRKLGPKHGNIMCLTGGCSSNSLRGHAAIVCIMDEFAFFVQNGGRFSDESVYKSLTPSTSGFQGDGKKIILSSPYTKSGYFYTLYQNSFVETENTLMFKMYSCLVNPYNIASQDLKTARRRDRVSFMCEFGGEFSDTITAWIDDPEEFKKNITMKGPPSKGKPDVSYYMGIDLGFKNDGTSIVIVHKEGDKVILDYAQVWFAGQSDVWESEKSIYSGCNKYAKNPLIKMSDIVEEIKELCRWFPIKEGIFDQMTGYGLQERLHTAGFKQFEMIHFTDIKNHEVYQCVKGLYAEQLLELWDDDVLVPEMLMLEAERKSKNKVEVRALNGNGNHDDLSDAYVRAVWLCNKGTASKSNNIATGAGGHLAGSRGGRIETQASAMIKKRRMHGEHPRGLDKMKRRRPGAVI